MPKKIFLIEDDLFLKDMYEKIFLQEGYDVVTAADGEEALSKMTTDIDLILLDIMLPKKNGLDVLRVIKAPDSAFGKIPVYLLTNLGQDTIIKEAMGLGAAGYLIKASLLPKQVVKLVNEFLQAPKSTSHNL